MSLPSLIIAFCALAILALFALAVWIDDTDYNSIIENKSDLQRIY